MINCNADSIAGLLRIKGKKYMKEMQYAVCLQGRFAAADY
jgi:hypothetical protein